jgi:MarR-like DNA-binding transcriptional regulator SgrR of sgrS sRNA
MSYLYSDMVYEVRGLTHIQFRVLSNLARYVDVNGKNAYPNLSTLALSAECSERYTRETLRELEEKHLIVARSKTGGRGKATVYDITLPVELIEAYKQTHKKKYLRTRGKAQEKIVESHWDQLFEQ